MKVNFSISRFRAWGQGVSYSEFLGFFIEVAYLAIIFLAPLWFAAFYSGFNIFELDKIIVFRSLLWVVTTLTVARALFFTPPFFQSPTGRKQATAAFKKYFLIPVLLVAGLAFVLLFSFRPQISFFGSYERQEGVSSYFFYFLWSLLIFFNLTAWRFGASRACSLNAKIKRILIAATLSASLVAIYGILQILNIDFLSWPEPPYLTGRALSTLGQPNFFASFLLLTIPLAVYLAYSSRHFRTKALFAFSALFQIIGLFSTSSRGGLVALLLVGLFFVIHLFLASKLKTHAKTVIAVCVMSIFILGIAVLEIFTPGRLQESFNLGTGSFAARINFFQASADAILKKPFFGYGPENGGEVFIKYYDNDWGVYADVSSNTDRAHNIILDTLLNAGFFGLLLFSLWYYSFFKLVWLNYRRTKSHNIALALGAAALGFLSSLLFSFTIVVAEIYFWLLFALLAALHFDQDNLEAPALFSKKRLSAPFKFGVLIIFCALTFWQIILNARSLIADSYFNDIYVALSQGEPIKAIVLHDDIRALGVNQVQQNFVSHFIGDNLGIHLAEAQDLATLSIIKKELETIAEDLPDKGYQNILLKAKIASELGEYERADKYFALAVPLAPNWPLVYLERGRDFLRRGQLEEAEEAYKIVDTQLPDVSSVNINDRHKKAAQSYRYMMYTDLARAYLDKGDYDRAAKFFKAAYVNMIEDYSLLKKIADTYYLRGDLDTAISYVAHGSLRAPGDYNWQVALAELYYEKGDKSAALKNIESAIKIAPDKPELIKLKEKYSQ